MTPNMSARGRRLSEKYATPLYFSDSHVACQPQIDFGGETQPAKASGMSCCACSGCACSSSTHQPQDGGQCYGREAGSTPSMYGQAAEPGIRGLGRAAGRLVQASRAGVGEWSRQNRMGQKQKALQALPPVMWLGAVTAPQYFQG